METWRFLFALKIWVFNNLLKKKGPRGETFPMDNLDKTRGSTSLKNPPEGEQFPGSPWPPFFIGWFPNHHYFSRGENHHPKGSTIFNMVATTSREFEKTPPEVVRVGTLFFFVRVGTLDFFVWWFSTDFFPWVKIDKNHQFFCTTIWESIFWGALFGTIRITSLEGLWKHMASQPTPPGPRTPIPDS